MDHPVNYDILTIHIVLVVVWSGKKNYTCVIEQPSDQFSYLYDKIFSSSEQETGAAERAAENKKRTCHVSK